MVLSLLLGNVDDSNSDSNSDSDSDSDSNSESDSNRDSDSDSDSESDSDSDSDSDSESDSESDSDSDSDSDSFRLSWCIIVQITSCFFSRNDDRNDVSSIGVTKWLVGNLRAEEVTE